MSKLSGIARKATIETSEALEKTENGTSKFDPQEAITTIETAWRSWAYEVGAKKFVLGVSGGKDSTVVAALASRLFGKDNVYGVLMPNGVQPDISDSNAVIAFTGIHRCDINIRNAFDAVHNQVQSRFGKVSESARINLAPRIRMATLYAVAQTVGGFVLNTDNLSERVLGYFTAYGDGAGDYAPLKSLTATEVVRLGEYLEIPDSLIHKKPGDGLQPQGDEDRFGFTYADMDNLIRTGVGPDDLKVKVITRMRMNRFKTQIVDIPGPHVYGPFLLDVVEDEVRRLINENGEQK